MKIVIAPDSFKENLTSLEVASELETGLKRVWPDATYVKVPMADGGEGTVQSLVDATGGQIVKTEVSGPMGVRVMASYGLLGDGKTAVIEMAEASGLPLVPKEQRDPLVATTYGTGELIADAIKRGVTEIILGIGGSATNDAGAGLAQALGVRFLNFGGAPIRDLIAGGDLDDVQAVDMSAVNPGLAKSTSASPATSPTRCAERRAPRASTVRRRALRRRWWSGSTRTWRTSPTSSNAASAPTSSTGRAPAPAAVSVRASWRSPIRR